MRKKILFALVILVLVLTGCSSTTVKDPKDGDPKDEDPIINTKVEVSEQVVFDKNDVKVTVKGIADDGFFGPELELLLENNSSKSIVVQSRDSSINGFMISSILSSTIAPGKKINDTITFMSSDLDECGIEYIKDIEFYLEVMDADSYNTLASSEVIKITTTADASLVKSKVFEGKEILNKDGIKILLMQLEVDGSFLGSEIFLYIENNGNKNIMVQLDETSVNGFMVSAIFSSDISVGKKIVDSITIMNSDLEDNDIKSIENFEFKLRIMNQESWDTLYESPVIKVDFE